MFYFPTLSSMFKRSEYKRKVINKLEYLKDDINNLVEWDKEYVEECKNVAIIDGEEKDKYNKDYLELQRLVNKILKVKED